MARYLDGHVPIGGEELGSEHTLPCTPSHRAVPLGYYLGFQQAGSECRTGT